mmetsp:Transcript_13952/g.28098  ORF Transcript_13952/g.28098 Transcript_13952/m.28098 type:complete len:106 (-) Transcript_13952:78-395(-)
MLGGEHWEAVVPHELLLSTGALYLLRERRVLLALPLQHVERLEAPPPPTSHEGPSSRRMLAVFIEPAEATRLGISSCMQYVVRAHAAQAFIVSYELTVWPGSAAR